MFILEVFSIKYIKVRGGNSSQQFLNNRNNFRSDNCSVYNLRRKIVSYFTSYIVLVAAVCIKRTN